MDGVIGAADRVLGRCRTTRPASSPATGRSRRRPTCRPYRDTVKLLRDRIAKLKAEGKTRDAVIAAKPTADYDAKWGQGFIKPDVFTGLVFDSLP